MGMDGEAAVVSRRKGRWEIGKRAGGEKENKPQVNKVPLFLPRPPPKTPPLHCVAAGGMPCTNTYTCAYMHYIVPSSEDSFGREREMFPPVLLRSDRGERDTLFPAH